MGPRLTTFAFAAFASCIAIAGCDSAKGTPDPDDIVATPEIDASTETVVPTDVVADDVLDVSDEIPDGLDDGSDAGDTSPDDAEVAAPDATDTDSAPSDADGDGDGDGDSGDDADAPQCAPGTPCDDGNPCTLDDSCNDLGDCVGGTLKACDDGDPCTQDTCLEATGECGSLPNPGASCDDGEVCTVFDLCQFDGSCLGEPNPCDDGDPCTADTCDFGQGCVHNAACDDANPCTTDSCAPDTGACTNAPVAPGTACDDGDLCTDGTTCDDATACTGGDATITCDDANPCTIDRCEPSTGACAFDPAVGEKCEDDGDVCTLDRCDETGVCAHPANPACGVIAADAFACGAASTWTFETLVGEVAWDIDGQPLPSDFEGSGCSLNFNKDALTYASSVGASNGTATSAEIDATAVPTTLYLALWSYLDTADAPSSEYDNAEIRISTDGFATYDVLALIDDDDVLGAWTPMVLDISSWAGTYFQLQFSFDTVDEFTNSGAGWFVDNIKVTGTLPTEICDDDIVQDDYDLLGDCTDPDCALAPNCLVQGDTCLLPFQDLDLSNLPASHTANTGALGPHYGVDSGQCFGLSASAGGGFLQGSADAVYAVTPPQTGQYVFTLDASFNSALYIGTDCGDLPGSCVAGANNAGFGAGEVLSVHLEADVTYFVTVDGAAAFGDSDAGTYTLSVERPGESSCVDGEDNDGDSVTDCQDPVCALAPDCGIESCVNGVDDDNDGLVDCDDAECNPTCIAEVCDNLGDDDDDGDVDCDDAECTLAPACVAQGDTCDNPIVIPPDALPYTSGVIDTTNWLPHYGDDGGCLGSLGASGGSAGVGAPDVVYSFTPDNAGVYSFTYVTAFEANVYVLQDCEALTTTCRGIASANALLGVALSAGETVFVVLDGASNVDASQGGTGQLFVELAGESDCDDDVDNDGANGTDCDDPLCAYAPNCVPEANCFDGVDNDFDGAVDCDDDECLGLCAEAGQCEDGIDNDGDGDTDCEDLEDCAAEPACIPEVCDNDADDDGDGDTDCDDDECAQALPCLPPGDACGNAIVITGLPFDHDGNTCDLGHHVETEAGAGCNAGGGELGDAVYSYTAPEDQVLWLSLPKAATAADLQLNVSDQCAPVIGECIGSSDVGGLGGEFITLDVVAGQTITIVVDGDSAIFQPSCGPYRLHIERQSPEIGACDDGIDNDEDGFFDCADPLCKGDPVCGCSADADCDDANICTSDHCSTVEGAQVCTFSPIHCDDGDACTANRCDPAGGCFYPTLSACPAPLPYATDFHCGDLDWSFETFEGTVSWAIDGTPNPPAYQSPECSLNFNNGVSYDSLDEEPSNGVATLVPIDASGATTLWLSYVDLFLAESTTFETRTLQVSADGGAWMDLPSGHISNQKGTWRWRKHDLTAFAGSASVVVRFLFDSQDQLTNDEEGWFVDDLRVTEEEPGLGEVCDDGIDNDEDLLLDCDDAECAGISPSCL